MPDEVLFVGGRRDSMTVLGTQWSESTTAGRFDPAYSDCATWLINTSINNRIKFDLYSETSNALSKVTLGTGQRLFVHFVSWQGFRGSGVGGNNMFELLDSNGFPWFAIRSVSPNTSNIWFNSGTGASPVWTQIGAGATITETLLTWDVEFTLGSPHSVNVYLNGSIWRSGTFTQASFTDIASGAFGPAQGENHFVSQIIATENISTIGSFVKTARATGIGANVGFTGNHTAVNEVIQNDSTFQSATTAGLRTTHVMSDVVVPTGLEIRAVFHWLRAKNDGSAPNNIRSVLRSGGIDYVTPNIPLIGVGYSPVGARYNVDPLGTNWTEAEWNGIEAGYESAT